jgi:hypothetical protein
VKILSKLLAVAVLAVMLTAAPAGATSRSRVVATITTIGGDLGDVADAANASDLDTLSVVCESLTRHATTGLGYTRPASINRTAWRHMRKSWSLLAQAGVLCVNGADNVDPDSINSATTLMGRASDETDLATEAM